MGSEDRRAGVRRRLAGPCGDGRPLGVFLPALPGLGSYLDAEEGPDDRSDHAEGTGRDRPNLTPNVVHECKRDDGGNGDDGYRHHTDQHDEESALRKLRSETILLRFLFFIRTHWMLLGSGA